MFSLRYFLIKYGKNRLRELAPISAANPIARFFDCGFNSFNKRGASAKNCDLLNRAFLSGIGRGCDAISIFNTLILNLRKRPHKKRFLRSISGVRYCKGLIG